MSLSDWRNTLEHLTFISDISPPRRSTNSPPSGQLVGAMNDYTGRMNDNLLDENDDEKTTQVSYTILGNSDLSATPKNFSQDHDLRLVVAIDFGTTYTGAAFASSQNDTIDLDRIQVVRDWQEPNMMNQDKIPSIYSYGSEEGQRDQWGSDVAENSPVVMNIKMRLSVQERRIDELILTLQLLEKLRFLDFGLIDSAGGPPVHLWRSPSQVVEDYLKKICDSVCKRLGLGRPARVSHPIDLVITVPVGWSFKAIEATYRAMRAAGFNKKTFPTLEDTILVKEPEAAAYYTSRRLQASKIRAFKLKESFVLIDAGGGTVDLMSYQIEATEPRLVLREVSIPTSGKCGATFIDANFKRLVRHIIGEDEFQKLDPDNSVDRLGTHSTETGPMRQLMKNFDSAKKSFSKTTEYITVELPEVLKKLNINEEDVQAADGLMSATVSDGLLKIPARDIRDDVFDPVINKIVRLMEAQVVNVEEALGRGVRYVLLVGGMGESPYLRETLEEVLDLYDGTRLLRPDSLTSWTAVVQGAVIYGIEKKRHANIEKMLTVDTSYAIDLRAKPAKYNVRDQIVHGVTGELIADQQLQWLISKGDLMLESTGKTVEKTLTQEFGVNTERKIIMSIWACIDENEARPMRMKNGENEIKRVMKVECDLSTRAAIGFQTRYHLQTGAPYQMVTFKLRLVITPKVLRAEIVIDGIVLGSAEHSLVDNSSRAAGSRRAGRRS